MRHFADELEKAAVDDRLIDAGAGTGTLLAGWQLGGAALGKARRSALLAIVRDGTLTDADAFRRRVAEMGKTVPVYTGGLPAERFRKILSPEQWAAMSSTQREEAERALESLRRMTRTGARHQPRSRLVESVVPGWKNLHGVIMEGNRSRAVLEHEFGHATGRPVRPSVRLATRGAGFIASGLGAARGLTGAFRGEAEDREKAFRQARNLTGLGWASSNVPVLYEEARATGRALRAGPKGSFRRFVRVLAPAYGTYLAHAGVKAVLPAAFEVARRRAKSVARKQKQKASTLKQKTAARLAEGRQRRRRSKSYFGGAKPVPITAEEMAAFRARLREAGLRSSPRRPGENLPVALAKTEQGFCVHTHRARCGWYPHPAKIPLAKIKFIASTG